MARPILEVCDSFVGIKENPPRSNKTILGARYGRNGVAWCGIAVAMAYQDAGMDLRKILTPNMAYTPSIMDAAKKKGWFLPARQAKPTDIVLYHMPGGRAGVNHTGIVKSVNANGIVAYEGNTSGSGSQFNGGAYLVKSRPWKLILGVVRVPGADRLGYNQQPPAPPAPAQQLPVRQALVVFNTGRMVEIAQWELAAISGEQFIGEVGVYGPKTKDAIFRLGKILGKGWDGNWIGPDQWAAIDFLYMLKGHQPVLA